LQESATKVKICLQNIETDNVLLKKFFNISIQKIRTRAKLWNNAADIVVSANAGSSLKIAADVIREIENYFLK